MLGSSYQFQLSFKTRAILINWHGMLYVRPPKNNIGQLLGSKLQYIEYRTTELILGFMEFLI